MQKKVLGLVLIAASLSLVPFALITRSRAMRSATPPVHLILDMDKQPKFRAQRENPMFADGRAMRPLINGTLAREDMAVRGEPLNDPENPRMIDGQTTAIVFKDQAEYDRILLGQEKAANGLGQFVSHIPVPVTPDFLKRGQERFTIYCTPCHGHSGYGDGAIARRAAEFQEAGSDAASGWVKPTDYHTPDMRSKPDGHYFNVITNGIRSMPRYDKQISVMDRWAIVAYVRALQRSQNATAQDVPETEQSKFK